MISMNETNKTKAMLVSAKLEGFFIIKICPVCAGNNRGKQTQVYMWNPRDKLKCSSFPGYLVSPL